ncbi:uncharacterized protein NEMAJ01_0078 [Nematocida major]|uniref:uncharacterized protein n=1 Tax=Nematocida major TaxID=1912982 RepID=UPI002008E0C3|nr:uncharacterized protein NEMAJ01_0078 [Nematocida major]KAH9385182.1 hypothetical protein NEMAJ01_0078 [Nematocida major]
MNSGHKGGSDQAIADMLEKLENEKYSELVEDAWSILYNIIIPFNTEDVHKLLCDFIIILTQAIPIESVTEEAAKILSVVDLIVHPRKGTIIEGKYEIDDLVEELPSAASPSNQEGNAQDTQSKKVKVSIIE